MSVDPKGFSKGKRGIAGSLIFTIFDRSALSRVINAGGSSIGYYARPTDVAKPGDYSAIRTHNLTAREDVATLNATQGIGEVSAGGLFLNNDVRPINYVDQMPAFDVTLSAENEAGNRMFMQIFGVQLLNQGSGVSVDD